METNAVYFGELSNNRQRLSIDIRHLRSLSGSQAQCRQIRRRLELEGRQRQGILIKILNRSGETEALHAEFVAGMARVESISTALQPSSLPRYANSTNTTCLAAT